MGWLTKRISYQPSKLIYESSNLSQPISVLTFYKKSDTLLSTIKKGKGNNMGSIRAIETADAIKNGEMTLEYGLRDHLAYNHYPPVPFKFLPVCKKAIRFGNMGKFDYMITLPNGLIKTVGEIIEGLHLNHFLDDLNDVGY